MWHVYGLIVFIRLVLAVDASPPTFLRPDNGDWGPPVYIESSVSTSFQCQATGPANISYLWRFNSTDLTTSTPGINLSASMDTLTTQTSFSDRNNGHYLCLAKSVHGAIMTSPLLLINAKYNAFPDVSETEKINVKAGRKGEYESLPCKNVPNSQPPMSISWSWSELYKEISHFTVVTEDDRLVVDPEGNLHFLWIDEDDNEKNFTCAGSYHLRSIQVFNTQSFLVLTNGVLFQRREPKLVYGRDVTVFEGDDATLVCLFSYYSPSERLNITWYKDGESVGKGRRLTISSIRWDDTRQGNYTCVGQLGTSKAETTVQLRVIASPKFVTNEKLGNMNVTFGSQAQFRCRAVSKLSYVAPPVWLVNGKPVLGCPPDQFKCGTKEPSGRPKCLPLAQKCDGVKQCPDDSDESICSVVCKPEEGLSCETCTFPGFRCKDGSGCIHGNKKCNAKEDCRDLSDEKGCDTSEQITVGSFKFNSAQTQMTIDYVTFDDNMCVQCMVTNNFGTTFSQGCLHVTDEHLHEETTKTPTSTTEEDTITEDTLSTTVTEITTEITSSAGKVEDPMTQDEPATMPVIAIILTCAAMLLIVIVIVIALYRKAIICNGGGSICNTSQQQVTTPHSSFLDMYNGIETTLTRCNVVSQGQMQPSRDPDESAVPDHIEPFL